VKRAGQLFREPTFDGVISVEHAGALVESADGNIDRAMVTLLRGSRRSRRRPASCCA